MALSFNLEWKNLNLEIKKSSFNLWKCKTRTEEKTILNNVSGSLKSGQLIAILGASGAGKTTLLAGISHRYRGPMDGQLLLNGTPIDHKTMTKLSCFVPQFDVTIDTLTPIEHLSFMAELKLDRRWSRSRKAQRVDLLMRELGLQQVASNRISSLSGGERKKLDLATDLLTNPPIIFCDEPTTGLDSFNARKVIEALKYLTDANNDISQLSPYENGLCKTNDLEMSTKSQTSVKMPAKAIIRSIHQPTSDIFQCFSHVILMHAGRCVFQGNTDEAFEFFARLGFHCPSAYNPADFFIKTLSQTENKLQAANSVTENHEEFNTNQTNDIEMPLNRLMLKQYESHNSLWLKQVWVLLQRSFINTKRNSKKFLIALIFYLVPFLTMGLLYTNIVASTQENVQNIQGLFFGITCEIMFSTMYRILTYYLVNTPLLRRETNERVYSISAYYVAGCLSDFPFLSIRPLFGLIITYNLAGFSRGIAFFCNLYATLILLAFTANAYGLMLVGVFRSIILEAPTVFNLTFMVVSGAYANLSDYPMLKFTSLFYYAYEAMSIFFWNDVKEIDCSARFEGVCLRNGTEVLTNISFNTHLTDAYWDFLGLIILGLVMHTMAFIGIRRFIRSTGYY